MKTHKLLAFIALPLLLSSCSLFEEIGKVTGNGGYSSYEEYFEKELGYKQTMSIADVNAALKEEAYWWEESTGTYSGQDYVTYMTSRNIYVSVYSDKMYVTTTSDASMTIYKDGSKDYLIYAYNDNNTIGLRVDTEGHRWRLGDTTKDENRLTETEKAFIHLYRDNEGYLIEIKNEFYMYLTKDYSKFYLNEDNEATFQGVEDTYNVNIETLGQSSFANLGEAKYIELPLMDPTEDGFWYGMHYNEAKTKKVNYRVILPGLEPYQYADYLKERGYTVYRANNEDIITDYQRRDEGLWYALDENEDMEIVFRNITHLYHNGTSLFNVQFYGPLNNTELWISKIGWKKTQNKTGVTSRSDWKDYEKETIRSYYDLNQEIPFAKLGSGYSVPSIMSYAYEDVFSTVLAYGTQCYNIRDYYYHDLTEEYKQVLLENGYHSYDYGDIDFNDNDQYLAWRRSDESKYYNCYINEEKDLAIKVYFDITNGNTIRVFQYSKMEAWVYED